MELIICQYFILSLLLFLLPSENAKILTRPNLETFNASKDKDAKAFDIFLTNCAQAKESGIYWTQVNEMRHNITMRCEADFYGGQWTVIQRRSAGRLDFQDTWNSYKYGFGELTDEFWFGLEYIFHMARSTRHEIIFIMENAKGTRNYALFNKFTIRGEKFSYALRSIGNYAGDAGNSMNYHVNKTFSTIDRKTNDPKKSDCSKLYGGGWWFDECFMSNCNGNFPTDEELYKRNLKCMTWVTMRDDIPLTFSQIMMRPIIKSNWIFTKKIKKN